MADQTGEKKKTLKIGAVLDGKFGHFITLGSSNNPKPEFNRTVQIRVLDNNGNVIYQGTNPKVKMYKPFKEGTKVVHELKVSLEETK